MRSGRLLIFAMEYNIKQVNHWIRNRRSIYPVSYTQEKIEDDIIQNILENANWAPTHKLTEPWRFVVFTGEGLKALADFQASMYRRASEALGNFQQQQFEKLSVKPLQASHVIAICMKRDPKHGVPEVEEIASVACAVQNMYLTASAYDLGCYWSTGGVTYMEEAKSYFKLEENDRLMGFFYLGHTDIERPSGRRKPIEDKVKWVDFMS